MWLMNNAWTDNKLVGKFGVSYLDDKLHGIMTSDLVLIGAGSGAGKSSLANHIAFFNRDSGFKTSLYSLENFANDLYMEKAYLYYINTTKNWNCTLREFATGDFRQLYNVNDKNLFIACNRFANESYHDIIIHTREQNYNIQKLCDSIGDDVVNKGAKLIILDHVDYLDKMDSNDSDNAHMTLLFHTIRELQNTYKIGFVAISHLRKSQGNAKEKMIVPTLDEFIGSSNKAKESTICCLFAPDFEYNESHLDSHLKGTFCCIRKNRMGGIDNKCARLFYNIRKGRYMNTYDMLKVNAGGTQVETLETISKEETDGSFGMAVGE